jgi:hypothetical protein
MYTIALEDFGEVEISITLAETYEASVFAI